MTPHVLTSNNEMTTNKCKSEPILRARYSTGNCLHGVHSTRRRLCSTDCKKEKKSIFVKANSTGTEPGRMDTVQSGATFDCIHNSPKPTVKVQHHLASAKLHSFAASICNNIRMDSEVTVTR